MLATQLLFVHVRHRAQHRPLLAKGEFVEANAHGPVFDRARTKAVVARRGDRVVELPGERLARVIVIEPGLDGGSELGVGLVRVRLGGNT